MLGKWWTLKMLVSVAVITYALAQQEININEDDNIKKAVDFFNSQENTRPVFKQYSYLGAGYEQIVEGLYCLPFLAKETGCSQTQEYKLDECDFHPEGEIKLCVTYVSDELDLPNAACSTISENCRSKRSGWKTFFKKIKKGAKKLLQNVTPILSVTLPFT